MVLYYGCSGKLTLQVAHIENLPLIIEKYPERVASITGYVSSRKRTRRNILSKTKQPGFQDLPHRDVSIDKCGLMPSPAQAGAEKLLINHDCKKTITVHP